MPFYMFQARYTAAAIKAMVDNPQDREAAARPLIEAVGGKLHHLFFCFGADDVVALIEAPNDEAMAAGTMAVGASGAFSESGATMFGKVSYQQTDGHQRPLHAMQPSSDTNRQMTAGSSNRSNLHVIGTLSSRSYVVVLCSKTKINCRGGTFNGYRSNTGRTSGWSRI